MIAIDKVPKAMICNRPTPAPMDFEIWMPDCDKWAGFSQVWCHCCSTAIVRQTFRGSGNVTEDQQLSRALPEEDMTRTNDAALITLPLSYHRHTIGKDFTQVIEIFQPMRECWGVRYCSLFAPLWAVWGNLRLFVGSCPNSYRPPFGHANLCFAQGSFL